MIVIPAIDIRGGRVVRLRQGAADRETVYAEEPAVHAARFARAGAAFIHVVDLDGAFEGKRQDTGALRAVVDAAPTASIQVGGGIRTLGSAEELLALGVRRVILGTAAARDPSLAAQAVDRFGAEAVIVGVDAREGRVAVEGWTERTDIEVAAFARTLADLGVRRLIFTDIARDGCLSGPNVEAVRRLVADSGLFVIASGGVGSAADIRDLASAGAEGAIVGRALYEGQASLDDLLAAAMDRE